MTTIPDGGNHPQRMPEIGNPARTSRPSRPQGTPEEGGAPSPASLQLSARGERFLSLRARLEGLDASRPERVEHLRRLVADGLYQVDSEAVAAAMLADPATAAALGVS